MNNSDHLWPQCLCSCSEFLWDPPSASMTCLVSPLTLFLNACVISVWLLWLYKSLLVMCVSQIWEEHSIPSHFNISRSFILLVTSKAELIIFPAPTCSFFRIPWWVIVYIFCLLVYWGSAFWIYRMGLCYTLRLETPLWSFTWNSLCWPHFAFQPPSKFKHWLLLEISTAYSE